MLYEVQNWLVLWHILLINLLVNDAFSSSNRNDEVDDLHEVAEVIPWVDYQVLCFSLLLIAPWMVAFDDQVDLHPSSIISNSLGDRSLMSLITQRPSSFNAFAKHNLNLFLQVIIRGPLAIKWIVIIMVPL